MKSLTLPRLTSRHHELQTDPEAFGWLEPTDPALEEGAALSQRLAEQGYLYLPGFFDREAVLKARGAIVGHLATCGGLLPGSDPDEALPAKEGYRLPVGGDGLAQLPVIRELLYGPQLLGWFSDLLQGAVRHYDFTWFRSVAQGGGTHPHCDIVYMGRGTKGVYTSWVPYGDIPLEMGGLMLLEGSHRQADRLASYLETDVDSYCENRSEKESGRLPGRRRGWLSSNPATLREKLGGRWLTAPEFRAGDLVVFGMHLVHGSLDNGLQNLRLSTDSRYQLASEAADERWVGAEPIGHRTAALRGRIC